MKKLTKRQRQVLRNSARYENDVYSTFGEPCNRTTWPIKATLVKRGFLIHECRQLSPTCWSVKPYITAKGKQALAK